LLENIVGLDFLPRGSGVVTRRPLEMRLVHVAHSGKDAKPWAVFGTNKTEKFYDFDKVRTEIER
jgi:dynamin 1-like protein